MSALPLRRVCPENVQTSCLRLRLSDTPTHRDLHPEPASVAHAWRTRAHAGGLSSLSLHV
jgi:hypothetical protein